LFQGGGKSARNKTTIQARLQLLPLGKLLRFLDATSAKVPRLDKDPLRSVDVIFIADLFNANAHAVLSEGYVLTVHLLRCSFLDLGGRHVDMIEDKCDRAYQCEEDYQGDELSSREDYMLAWVNHPGGEDKRVSCFGVEELRTR
jgi:hypothetical protein